MIVLCLSPWKSSLYFHVFFSPTYLVFFCLVRDELDSVTSAGNLCWSPNHSRAWQSLRNSRDVGACSFDPLLFSRPRWINCHVDQVSVHWPVSTPAERCRPLKAAAVEKPVNLLATFRRQRSTIFPVGITYQTLRRCVVVLETNGSIGPALLLVVCADTAEFHLNRQSVSI